MEQEEFIANRMAEFLLKRTGKYGEGDVNFLRTTEETFTKHEEDLVRGACEETLASLKRALQHQNLADTA